MKRIKVSADTIEELRGFLVGAQVDFGCRPVALRRGGRFESTVFSEAEEAANLRARRMGTIQVEELDDLPEPAAKLRLAVTGNRFASGDVPKGLGDKE